MPTAKEKIEEMHKKLTENLIEEIKNGTAPWQMPWGLEGSNMILPVNAISHKRYQGGNTLMLMYLAKKNGYKDPRWLTFKQAGDLKAHVKKGEKAAMIEYWQFDKKVEMEKDDGTKEKVTVKLKCPIHRIAFVFNAEQCEDMPVFKKPELKWEPVERAENIIKANGVPFFNDAPNESYYSPLKDQIHLPPKEAFKTSEDYYGVALHEAAHSTGHSSRLNRKILNYFGTTEYAQEELRAEISSMFLCNDIGLKTDVLKDRSAAYVENWLSVLKKDPNEIFKAARDAQDVCDYLYVKEKEYLKTKGVELPDGKTVELPETSLSEGKEDTQKASMALSGTTKKRSLTIQSNVSVKQATEER